MKKLCLLLLALLALTLPAAAGSSPAPVRAVVLYEDGADPEALSAALADTAGVTLLWRYSAFFPGAAVEAEPAALEALEALGALPGVLGVEPAGAYCPLSAPAGFPASAGTAPAAGSPGPEGPTGDGVVIAVLDSGFRVSHEVFADASLTLSPALTAADTAALVKKGVAPGRCVSARIPFAYDYCGRDDNVFSANDHGTHVAALAAGFARDRAGNVRFLGGAPGAQLLAMKIFPDGEGGRADDAVILRALEDAWNLGADVINLSVGTGAGFSRDGILDGAYSRAFDLLARSGVVVCCAAGNEGALPAARPWGDGVPAAGYTDYGTVCAPASYRGTVAVGALGADGSVADYSSWGPASALHLVPALTAFGGPVSAASAQGDRLYREDTGTSMASAAAAGVFAAALQSLEERGITDSSLARDLLESAAAVLTEEGVPVSPRRQGAGRIDLSAALSAGLVIREPLVELGAEPEGEFSLTLTLENLTGRPLSVTLTPTVLTDAWEERDGKAYSLLKPLDITGRVSLAGSRVLTVPAHGRAEAALTLTVDAGLREELAARFPSGFYVEGYLTAAGGGETAHAAFLGYCGAWEAAPILEGLDFRDVEDVRYRLFREGVPEAALERPETWLSALGAEAGASLAYLTDGGGEPGPLLGANPHAWSPAGEHRQAMPSRDAGGGAASGRLLGLELYPLRNAAGLAALVSDPDTGEIWFAGEEAWLGKAAPEAGGTAFRPAARFLWDGRDAGGAFLPAGTRARVDVYAWLDTQEEIRDAYEARVHWGRPGEYAWLLEPAWDACRVLSFSLVLDGAPPRVEAAPGEVPGEVTLTVRDGQCAAWLAAWDEAGSSLAEVPFFPEEPGQPQAVTLRPGGTETVYLRVEDYAGNAAGYILDAAALLSGGGAEPERCDLLLLSDGDPGAWYHRAVDYVLSTGLMAPDAQGKFFPDRVISRTELAEALYRSAGSPVSPSFDAGLPFTDVRRDAPGYDALCWVYDQGVAAGQGAGIFGGGDGVSRQQLAVMLHRLAGKPEAGEAALSAFPDGGAGAPWAREALAWAAERGLLTGDGGRLDPAGPVTRAQAAEILYRYLEE